ncbi:hypothetical protein TrRE_jg7263, partial [Triparma retinervis]
MDDGEGYLSWYYDIPIITRSYFTLSLLLTTLTTLDLLSPFTLYYNLTLILPPHNQLHRALTSFCYFGTANLDFAFHMYFLVRYARMLEEGEFVRQRASFVLLLLLSALLILSVAPFLNLTFLGSSLTFCMLYIWGRLHPEVEMQMFGVLNFKAPYLPIVMLTFSLVIGNSSTVDLLGIM